MTILREHESTLQQWVLTLSPFHLAPHLKVATRHQLFNKYMSQVQGRKLEDFKDLIEFDLWLKKLEISEQGIGSPALAETSPESVETVKVVKTPKPAEPVKPERERKEPPRNVPCWSWHPNKRQLTRTTGRSTATPGPHRLPRPRSPPPKSERSWTSQDQLWLFCRVVGGAICFCYFLLSFPMWIHLHQYSPSIDSRYVTWWGSESERSGSKDGKCGPHWHLYSTDSRINKP